MKHRIRLSGKDYTELVESRDWCRRSGFSGLVAFYDEELAFQARRRALPHGSPEYQEQEDERPRRG